MELTELVVKLKAETSGFFKDIKEVKNEIKGLSEQTGLTMKEIQKKNDAYSKQIKEAYLKQLDEIIKKSEAKLQKLGDKLYKITTGRAKGDENLLGIQVDEQESYVKLLKQFKEAINGGGIYIDTAGIEDIPQELADITKNYDSLYQAYNSKSVFGEWAKEIEELSEKWFLIYGKLANVKFGTKPYKDIKKELADIEKQIDDIVEKSTFSGLYNKDTQKTSLRGASPVYNEYVLQKENGGINNKLDIKGSLGTITKAVLGIRSIYFLIRKLVSNNAQLTQAVDNFMGTLSNILEPILNFLASIIQAIASFIAKIFKVNVGTSKSSAETAKNTASFDEINNLSSSTGSEGTSVGSVKSNWESLEDFRDSLGDIADILDIIGVIFVALKIAELIANFDKIKTAIKGVIEIITKFFESGAWQTVLGIAVVILGVINLIQDVIAYINDPSWQNFTKILLDIAAIIAGLLIAFGVVTGGWAIALAALVVVVLKFKDEIAEVLVKIAKAVVEWAKNFWEGAVEWFEKIKESIKQWWENLKTNTKELISALGTAIKDSIRQDVANIKNMFNSFKENLISIANSMKNGLINAWNNIKTATVNTFTNIKTSLTNIWNGIWTTIKGVINKIINGVERMVNVCIEGINSLLSPLRNVGNSILKAVGVKSFSFNEISQVSLPRLATGTNYVPNDMVAMLHKGEAVVPAKYNDNNEETNSLLRQLINVVDSKEFRAYISQNDIGKSAMNYINKQSRMMGGSIL